MRRLLIRPGAIGDFVLSLPALESLCAGYTEVWCAEQNVPLARFFDRSYSIGSSGIDRIGLLPSEDVFKRLSKFDEIHSWYGANRPEFRAAVNPLPFHFYDALPSNSGAHATDFYCAHVGAASALPRIRLPERKRDFIVIHPFASRAEKRWPMDRFRELSVHLGDVRWCAGPEERLREAVRIPDLGNLAAWLAGARLFIGNDSGITHLSAAVGTPTVALFGPTDPAVWAPRGPNVRVIFRQPLEQIFINEVVLAAKELTVKTPDIREFLL